MKIIYGTGNSGKKKQVEDFFKATNVDVEIVSLKDIGFDKEIIEDGTTFEENSMIKAKEIQRIYREKSRRSQRFTCRSNKTKNKIIRSKNPIFSW